MKLPTFLHKPFEETRNAVPVDCKPFDRVLPRPLVNCVVTPTANEVDALEFLTRILERPLLMGVSRTPASTSCAPTLGTIAPRTVTPNELPPLGHPRGEVLAGRILRHDALQALGRQSHGRRPLSEACGSSRFPIPCRRRQPEWEVVDYLSQASAPMYQTNLFDLLSHTFAGTEAAKVVKVQGGDFAAAPRTRRWDGGTRVVAWVVAQALAAAHFRPFGMTPSSTSAPLRSSSSKFAGSFAPSRLTSSTTRRGGARSPAPRTAA